MADVTQNAIPIAPAGIAMQRRDLPMYFSAPGILISGKRYWEAPPTEKELFNHTSCCKDLGINFHVTEDDYIRYAIPGKNPLCPCPASQHVSVESNKHGKVGKIKYAKNPMCYKQCSCCYKVPHMKNPKLSAPVVPGVQLGPNEDEKVYYKVTAILESNGTSAFEMREFTEYKGTFCQRYCKCCGGKKKAKKKGRCCGLCSGGCNPCASCKKCYARCMYWLRCTPCKNCINGCLRRCQPCFDTCNKCCFICKPCYEVCCSCRSAGNCKCCQFAKKETAVQYPYRVEIQPIFRPKQDAPCGNLETVYYQDHEVGWMPLLSQANVPDATKDELTLLSALSVAQFRFDGFGFRVPGEDPNEYWIQEAKMTFESFLKRMTTNVANGSLNAMPTATAAPVVNNMARNSIGNNNMGRKSFNSEAVKSSSVRLSQNVSEAKPQSYKKLFSLLDTDKNGAISMQEFRAYTKRSQGINSDAMRRLELILKTSNGQHKELPFEEFVQVCIQLNINPDGTKQRTSI